MKYAQFRQHILRRNALLISALATLLLIAAAVFPGLSQAANETVFKDVSTERLYSEGIQYLKENGIIEGYPDGTFKPSSDINRAEFTKIIIGAITQDPKGENCFPDVTTQWFAKYVCEAKTRGIIEGYPDGNFKPAEKIKFSEASKIVANTFGLELSDEYGVNYVGPAGDITDSDSGNATWYHPFVQALETQKAIPVSVDFFDENITRDEMTEMVYRLKTQKTDGASRTYDEITGEKIISGSSCEALTERYRALNEKDPYFYPAIDVDLEEVMTREDVQQISDDTAGEAENAAVPTSAPASSQKGLGGGGDGASEYSQTNIQVEGVDEADIIKNDGKYMYLIRGNTVRIIDAYPAENMKELVSLQLGEEDEQFTPSEMYINGDQLIVIGNVRKNTKPVIEDSADRDDESSSDNTETMITTDSEKLIVPYPSRNRTKVFLINIQNRTKPSVTRWVEYDGYLQSSRRVGSNLYVVLNWSPYTVDYPIIPYMTDTGSAGIAAKTEETVIAPCPDIKILPKPQSWNNLIVSAVPLNNLNKKVSSEVIVGESGNVYASAENIYIASIDWHGGLYRSHGDYGTAVYRFGLNNGDIEYGGKGRVPGSILNQFSMDEWNGTFRIATTQTNWSNPRNTQTTNGLYTLDVDSMEEEGKIENIAPGERIYSARFMGNRGYIVTFRQTDPLFVLDLSNPKNPTIEGKLKIPGYSNYLHPYDENHLIGIGNEVDLAQSTQDSLEDGFVPWNAIIGVKLSLFDITNVNKPKELFKEVIGDRGTTSDAQYNHKAFLFDKEKNLLAFPIQIQELENKSCTESTYSSCPSSCQKVCVPSSCTYENGIRVCTTDCDGENSCRAPQVEYGKPSFNGAYAYGVDLKKGFTLRGKVTHYTDEEQSEAREDGYYKDWQKSIQRVLYMGDTFYSVSGKMVQANSLSDFATKNAITLSGEQYDYFIEY